MPRARKKRLAAPLPIEIDTFDFYLDPGSHYFKKPFVYPD